MSVRSPNFNSTPASPFAGIPPRRYWSWVGVYVVALLSIQSVMGLGIDKFKELWGEATLGVVAYLLVSVGAAGVAWVGWRVWARCTRGERAWIAAAFVLYGIVTIAARYPQERLHYTGYGLLAMLLYVGLARQRSDVDRQGNPAALVPAAVALLAGSSVGLVDELLQKVWPRRYFDWADVAMNVVAVGIGLLAAIPLWSATRRR